MRVHKVTMLVFELEPVHDDEAVREMLEEARYPNRCLMPVILGSDARDVDNWSDQHPLNDANTMHEAAMVLFDEDF